MWRCSCLEKQRKSFASLLHSCFDSLFYFGHLHSRLPRRSISVWQSAPGLARACCLSFSIQSFVWRCKCSISISNTPRSDRKILKLSTPFIRRLGSWHGRLDNGARVCTTTSGASTMAPNSQMSGAYLIPVCQSLIKRQTRQDC